MFFIFLEWTFLVSLVMSVCVSLLISAVCTSRKYSALKFHTDTHSWHTNAHRHIHTQIETHTHKLTDTHTQTNTTRHDQLLKTSFSVHFFTPLPVPPPPLSHFSVSFFVLFFFIFFFSFFFISFFYFYFLVVIATSVLFCLFRLFCFSSSSSSTS